jgi:cell division protein FtsI/penicillin-binding protein 2
MRLVTSINSSEILAMVNYPADDPNNKALYNPKHYRNRVLSDKLDPGSTVKPFTMLLALATCSKCHTNLLLSTFLLH